MLAKGEEPGLTFSVCCCANARIAEKCFKGETVASGAQPTIPAVFPASVKVSSRV